MNVAKTQTHLPNILNILNQREFEVQIGDRIITKERTIQTQVVGVGMQPIMYRKGQVIQKYGAFFVVRMDKGGYLECFFYEAITGKDGERFVVKAY